MRRSVFLWSLPSSDAFGQSPTDRGVFATLPGHDGLVTCVEFVDDSRLLSADDTGLIKLWRNINSSVWIRCVCVLHRAELLITLCRLVGPITKCSGAYKKHFCVMCPYTSGVYRDWQLGLTPEGLERRRTGCAPLYPIFNSSRMRLVGDLQEVETISMKGRYPLSVALAKLPQADGGNSGSSLLAIVLTTRHLHSSDPRGWKHRQTHSHLYAVGKCCMPSVVGIYSTAAEVFLSLSHRLQFLVTKTGSAPYAFARQRRRLNP